MDANNSEMGDNSTHETAAAADDDDDSSGIKLALKQIRVIKPFAGVSERYYQNIIHPKCKDGHNYDQIVLLHSNRIAVICLAPSHEIIVLKKSIKNIDFCGKNKNVNRLDNQVKGKGKKGAQMVGPESILCTLHCQDETSYPIRACMGGKIIEINKCLVDEPSLIIEKPLTDGYIAIIMPPLKK
ncbi:hypothetical protein DERF_007699 [Dermatophagoides farinae]|uniref:Actin-binding transcription modulator n=1 Tax=Dermatophagoides farinae TaxID=6954 RepID=A0A922I0W9_DERFA|nr:hypothetical protein DERF_007699 [Dermatophagoides farinae]